ncbi:VOC family protein [Terrimonas sp. NA20]|uniref:VOC family protein n=1 Tax=Terrimonas ginsenosidimutans TaxID=2908004 RepID=A0ABS9KZ49_9BACT|nr:VOC family protein [Terrimonas ginsenosidimutans]MCG2617507.1 VOC family protein [Terrimonas ginsenosidimutans]
MKVNPYLIFDGNAEDAFNFYKSVFGGEFSSVNRMGEAPGTENESEEVKNRLMHISLPLSETVTLMASDCGPGMGEGFLIGNNVNISIHPASREEADRLFNGLSAGGKVEMPMADMFWGDYFGSFTDKFGVNWMVNYSKHF